MKRKKKWWAWLKWNVPTEIVEARTEAAAKRKLTLKYGQRNWNVYRLTNKKGDL